MSAEEEAVFGPPAADGEGLLRVVN